MEITLGLAARTPPSTIYFLVRIECLKDSRVMVRLIVPIIQQRFEIDRGQAYTIHKNKSTVSNRRLPLSSRPLSRRVEMGMACYELTVEILFSLLYRIPGSDKWLMQPRHGYGVNLFTLMR